MAVLDHKLWRDLWKTKGQVIAVLAVITCGIAVYVAFYSSFNNLILTRDSYYSRYRFHDFSISLEKAPESASFRIASMPGVKNTRGRIVKDVNLTVKDNPENKIARLISLPARQENIIDGIHLVAGRFFSVEVPDEVVVEKHFFEVNQLEFGDRIEVTVNGRLQSLKIVGIAQSPEYVYAIRNAQEMLPNPQKFAIIWVQESWAESQLDLQGSINEIIGEVNDIDRLTQILDEAENILKPYGVFSSTPRQEQLSNWYLQSELDGLSVSAKITPAIFLIIAALILLILLSRMVQRERGQIGLLKAYGYRDWEIVLHYFKYAGLIGAIGGVLGYFLGMWMGIGMMGMYVEFYAFPILRTSVYPQLMGGSIIISVGTALFSALIVVRSVIQVSPASAMRDSPPVSGHRTPLESITFLWQRLSFTNKIIVRNIFRYPLRSLFTIMGVMMATAMLIMGYFVQDAMTYMLKHQFEEVQREDMRVSFYLERGFDALYDMQRLPWVERVEPQLMYPFKLTTGWKKKDLLVTGLPEDLRLFRLLDENNHIVPIVGDGLVLMSQTAKQLDLKIGDYVVLKPLIGKIEREHKVRIDQIITQYIGAGAYMRLESMSRLLNHSRALNAVLLKHEAGHKDDLNKILKDIPAIASVEVKQDSLDNFEKTIGESMGISNFFMLLFAGVIAVSVIYNSTAISITERRHEMASLRVLGYTPQEVGRIVFNENLFLSLTGLAIGLPFGRWLCQSMAQAYETDVYRFPFYLGNQTYLYTSFIILIFVGASNFLSRKRIYSIDMVEALKSRE